MTKKGSPTKTQTEGIVRLRSTLAADPQLSNRPGDTGSISVALPVASIRERSVIKDTVEGRSNAESTALVVTRAMSIALAIIMAD